MDIPMTNFKVVAVSDNSNSFGLKQMILVNSEGVVYTACANYLNVKEVNSDIMPHPKWGFRGLELVERKADAPQEILQDLFPTFKTN